MTGMVELTFGALTGNYLTPRSMISISVDRGVLMAYRDFEAPDLITQSSTDVQWVEWLKAEGVLHSPVPRFPVSCRLCLGPVNTRYSGEPFAYCTDCDRHRFWLDGFVPITYSLDSGIESMLHRFKDWTYYQWLNIPLGSLLSCFMRRHRVCIETVLGGPINLALAVPGDDASRTFNHLHAIVNGVRGAEEQLPWDWHAIRRVEGVPRPARKTVNANAYQTVSDVKGRRILLFDDTWTSGASMLSCAARLKADGASKVCGISLGRQLNSGSTYCNNQELVEHALTRGIGGHCVICSP